MLLNGIDTIEAARLVSQFIVTGKRTDTKVRPTLIKNLCRTKRRHKKTANLHLRFFHLLEADVGIEPAYTDLQSAG